MSTHSVIIEKLSDSRYRGIYCQFDGYLSHVGRVLHEHYQDPKKVSELIDLGELSVLDVRVHSIGKHSYSEPEKGTTIAYHRDRGEDLLINYGSTPQEVVNQTCHAYAYVFEEGAWHYAEEPSHVKDMIPLIKALLLENEINGR